MSCSALHRQSCEKCLQLCVFITIQVCEKCPNVKLERESELLTVHVEPGMEPGQVISFFEEGEPIVDGEVSTAQRLFSSSLVGPAHGFRDLPLDSPASGLPSLAYLA